MPSCTRHRHCNPTLTAPGHAKGLPKMTPVNSQPETDEESQWPWSSLLIYGLLTGPVGEWALPFVVYPLMKPQASRNSSKPVVTQTALVTTHSHKTET